jgi:hypothetical protein
VPGHTTVGEFRASIEDWFPRLSFSIISGSGRNAPDQMRMSALRKTYSELDDDRVMIVDYLSNLTEGHGIFAGPKLVIDESVRSRGGYRVEITASFEQPEGIITATPGVMRHSGKIWIPEINEKPYNFMWDEYGNCISAAQGMIFYQELGLYNEVPVTENKGQE